MNIRKLNLFCPLDGQKLQKYECDSIIMERCYAYCKKCKREYSVSIPKGLDGSIDFYWKEGNTQMRDTIKRRVK